MAEDKILSTSDFTFSAFYRENMENKSLTIEHQHNEYEFDLFVRADSTLTLNGQIYKISDGTMLLVGSQDMHRFVHEKDSVYKRYVITFSESFIHGLLRFLNMPDFLSILKRGPRLLGVSPLLLTHVQTDFSSLTADYKLWQTHNDSGLLAVMQIALLHLLTDFYTIQKKAAVKTNLAPQKQKVQDIISFIDHMYLNDLSLQEISNVSFLSKYYITRIFKSVTGYSIHEYIMQKRISQAQKLLIEDDKSIIEIALSCGFSNLSNFYRVFKNIAGITPRQYRLLYGPRSASHAD